MNHERMFNNLSNQLLEHLSHTEDELGFRLDKNMMHIPGSRKPLVYSGLTVELAKDNLSYSDGPDTSFDWFEMSGDLPREQGPSSSFTTHRQSSLDRPSNAVQRSSVSGFVHPDPKGLDLHPEEVLFHHVGEGDDDEIHSMEEAQRRMVDSPGLANWQDLHPDARKDEQRREVEKFKNQSVAKAFMHPSESFTGKGDPFFYSSDFDPASRQFDNPKIMKSWEDPGTPL